MAAFAGPRYLLNASFGQDRGKLVCEISEALIQFYHDPQSFEKAKRLVNIRLKSLADSVTVRPTSDDFILSQSKRTNYQKFSQYLHFLYEDEFSDYWNFFFYPALIRTAAPDAEISSFLKKFWLFQNHKIQNNKRSDNLKLASAPDFVQAVDNYNPTIALIGQKEMRDFIEVTKRATEGESLSKYLETLPEGSESKNAIKKLFAGDSNVLIMENSAMNSIQERMFHTGPKPDELAKFMLSKPESSLTHIDVWRKALEIADGDPIEAIGIIVLNLSFDAASNRNRTAILNSKIINVVIPSKEELANKNNFNFQPGFNYHFWANIAEGWFRSEILLRSRSFIYENFVQDDPSKGEADQLGIDVATKTMELLGNGTVEGCGG